ncbi:MAG: hypothetical protein KDB71_13105 [Mycobacterium sp.]|nr:hypothetical protein [Mycobacterium sp.]
MSAPAAGAAPNNGNGNSGGARNTIGQTISAIAKNGGGAAGVLGALAQLKPNNKGLANALQRVLSRQTKTPTPTPSPDPTTPPS